MKFILAVIIMILNLNPSHAEYTNTELLNMNLESLSADFRNDTAYSTGAGRITDDMPNSLSLARRAALSDARRGLLILKHELTEGIKRRPGDVSGVVPPVKILREYISEDIYVVEVQTSLSELIHEGRNEEIEEIEAITIEGEHEENISDDIDDYDDAHDDYDFIRCRGKNTP